MLEVYSTASKGRNWRQLVKACLVISLLLVVAALQTAAAGDFHRDGVSAHSHGCAICHLVHSPALAAGDCFAIFIPALADWHRGTPLNATTGDPSIHFESSRAPPVLL